MVGWHQRPTARSTQRHLPYLGPDDERIRELHAIRNEVLGSSDS